nr:hypothetical protein [Crocosphaera sp.]
EVSGGAGSKGSRERDYSLFTFLKTLHFIYVRLLIYVFRYDNKYKTISIQAGASESIAVIINADVKWEFV